MATVSLAYWGLAAEARAVTEGRKARRTNDTTFRVLSDTRPGVTYELHYRLSAGSAGQLLIACSCPWGRYDPRPVGCKHGALVARRLEREGLVARTAGGQWQATGAYLDGEPPACPAPLLVPIEAAP